MALIVENTGGSFERCPPGLHLARCYQIVDLGSQNKDFQGQPRIVHEVMLGWEIHGTDENGNPLRMRDGRPYGMFRNYTLSWSEKATLRMHLQSWRGKPFSTEEMRRFDLKNVLGAWCMLNVIEKEGNNGKTYSNVDSINPVPSMIKQNGLPQAVNPLQMFDIDDPDMDIFNSFSDYLKKKISESPEWKRRGVSSQVPEIAEQDSDIPF